MRTSINRVLPTRQEGGQKNDYNRVINVNNVPLKLPRPRHDISA